MPIRHHFQGDCVVTFITPTVELSDLLHEIESLAAYAHRDRIWRQIVVLAQGTTSRAEYVDTLTLADWLSAACEQFGHSYFACCATTSQEYRWLTQFTELLCSDQMSVKLFLTKNEADNWMQQLQPPYGESSLVNGNGG